MSSITVVGNLKPHEVPEVVLSVNDLTTVKYVEKYEADDTHTSLPCIEYNGKVYTPLEFFHEYKK